MSGVQINLPDDLKALAEKRAAEAGHPSLDLYLRSLIEADAEQAVSEELEALLLEGLASGPPVEATPAFWEDVRRRAEQRHASRARG